MKYIFLSVAIIAEVIGTTMMKQSDGFTRLWPSIVTAVSYLICFYFLSLSLREIPIGIAYAIWSGCGIILIASAAWLIYGQKLDAPALIGIALIVAGVAVMNLFSKSAVH